MTGLPTTNIDIDQGLAEQAFSLLQSCLHDRCTMDELRTLAQRLVPVCRREIIIEGEIPYRIADHRTAFNQIQHIAEKQLRRRNVTGSLYTALNSVITVTSRQIELLNTPVRDPK